MGTPEEPINESKGCGGVMRIAPAGFPPGQPFRTGCELAAITHGHPTGWLAAGYLAQLVHEVAEGASLDEGAVRALDVLRRQPGHEETARAVERALWLSRSPRGSAAEIESIGGGWVGEEALAIGLYAAMVAENFEHGVLLAVNHSGDSDSTGSVAGSLLGLVLGEQAIPRRWVERLELRDVIEQVADDLHRHYGTGTLPCAGGQCGTWARYPAS
jgi:ADP-ribosylglycohydrolase